MLLDNGVRQFTVRDCELLVAYFDIDQDGLLSYTEFMQMVLPCDNLMLRSEASQREPLGLDARGALSPQVERLLANFFEGEVGLHSKTDRLKTELHSRFDWNPSSVFNFMDATHDGFLNYRNLQLFLKGQGYFATDEELIAIIRRLDADADQKVTYQEFCETFGFQSKPAQIQ
jgi:Ca2+-binding EF-hand superfamily protein